MTKEEIDPTIQDLRKLSRYTIGDDIKLNCKDPITNAINIIALQGVDLESKDKTIGNYLKTIKDDNEKFKELYTTIETMHNKRESLKCCGNCKTFIMNRCYFNKTATLDKYGSDYCKNWIAKEQL